MKCVISVLGKDTTGIVAEVAVALRECGANIDDISQTLLGDIFSMTMIVTLNAPSVMETMHDAIEASARRNGEPDFPKIGLKTYGYARKQPKNPMLKRFPP